MMLALSRGFPVLVAGVTAQAALRVATMTARNVLEGVKLKT
jgi:hypothetical protein